MTIKQRRRIGSKSNPVQNVEESGSTYMINTMRFFTSFCELFLLCHFAALTLSDDYGGHFNYNDMSPELANYIRNEVRGSQNQSLENPLRWAQLRGYKHRSESRPEVHAGGYTITIN